MKTRRHRLLGIVKAACIPIALLAHAPAAQATETRIDKSLAAPAGAAVRVVNVAGLVNVFGSARADVHVFGTIDPGVERVDLVNEGGTIVVRVVLPRKTLNNNGSAKITVEMPAGSRLETSTVSADQTVQGVIAGAQLSTVSGDVTVRDLTGELQIKTVSGDMQLTGSGKPGKWRVSTVSGDLRLTRGAGTLDLASVSGDANVEFDQVNGIRGRTTSGDLLFRGRAVGDAEINFESVSGDVTLTLGAERGLSIEASTFSGDIGTCFGERGKPTSEYSPGESLTTKRGEGAAKLRVKSLSGDVQICDRL